MERKVCLKNLEAIKQQTRYLEVKIIHVKYV